MTFNENARIDTGKVSKRSGGRRGGMIAGGGVGIALLLVLQVLQNALLIGKLTLFGLA